MSELGLDHVGFMVRDLDAGAARWERLGFQLAPRSPQMGKVPGAAEMAPWATSNHCVMFQRGYLELIGITEPQNFNPWAAFIDRFEGIHITAFRCRDADQAFAELCDRTDGFDPPLQRQRNAPYGDGVRPFRFRNIFSQDDRYPEGRFIVIEHQTPEVIWQDALMTHPNGAVSFEEVIFCADPQAPTADRIAAITGVSAVDGLHALPGGGSASVLDPQGFAARFPGSAPPPDLPAASAVVVGVAELSHTRQVLEANGVPVHSADSDCPFVAAEAANGGVIAFRQV